MIAPPSAINPDQRLPAQRQFALAPKLARRLLILNVVALILLRLLRDADDFNDWDLIPFLNANTFDSLWQLLQRPEIHFHHPFHFSINLGSESFPSAVFLRGLGHISLYWSPVLLIMIYDAAFLATIYCFFSVLFADEFSQCVAWSLIAMSPIILTYPATSAFNMQAYLVIVLGLLGCEYFLQKRPILGTISLAMAAYAMPQGHPLGLFLPYYALCWLVLRAVLAHPCLGTAAPQTPTTIAARSFMACLALLGLVRLLQRTGGNYLDTISWWPIHSGPMPASYLSQLGERALLFLRQSFAPRYKVDGIPVGFAPYFLYLTAIVFAALVLRPKSRTQRADPTRRTFSRRLLTAAVAVGAIVVGYVPAFGAVAAVKSQRALIGDLFLAILTAHWIGTIRERRLLRPTMVAVLLASLLAASDLYYLYFTLSVDHSINHFPVFDFDMVDGAARHDLGTAIAVMRQQVEKENAALVIYYPKGYNENATDPAVFHARVLRNFGTYKRRPDLIFPCRWCEFSHGCPFPEVQGRKCSATCCYSDPLLEIASQQRAGKRVVLWWWREPRESRVDWSRTRGDLASDWPDRLLRRIRGRYAMVRIKLPQSLTSPPEDQVTRLFASGSLCYELLEKPRRRAFDTEAAASTRHAGVQTGPWPNTSIAGKDAAGHQPDTNESPCGRVS